MTEHKIIVGDSGDMSRIADGSVNLIVTSPPYPMIEQKVPAENGHLYAVL